MQFSALGEETSLILRL